MQVHGYRYIAGNIERVVTIQTFDCQGRQICEADRIDLATVNVVIDDERGRRRTCDG